MTYLYTITDPRSNLVFYVGITDCPENRFPSHMNNKKTKVYTVIQSILYEGLKPLFSIIDEGARYPMTDKESDLVYDLYSKGHPLVNYQVNKRVKNMSFDVTVLDTVNYDKTHITHLDYKSSL